MDNCYSYETHANYFNSTKGSNLCFIFSHAIKLRKKLSHDEDLRLLQSLDFTVQAVVHAWSPRII